MLSTIASDLSHTLRTPCSLCITKEESIQIDHVEDYGTVRLSLAVSILHRRWYFATNKGDSSFANGAIEKTLYQFIPTLKMMASAKCTDSRQLQTPTRSASLL